MISAKEYSRYNNIIESMGNDFDDEIGESLTDDDSQTQATNKAKKSIGRYQQQMQNVLHQALWSIGQNTLDHYAKQVDQELPDDLLDRTIKAQYRQKYYGASLNARIVLLRLQLNAAARKTAAVDRKHLGGLFSDTFPFGAQTNRSKRLLLGTAVKLEHDIANNVANAADIPLLKWTLSKSHKYSCQCETVASNIDKDVVTYLVQHQIPIKPEGLYFQGKIPNPPHPFCRCDLELVPA